MISLIRPSACIFVLLSSVFCSFAGSGIAKPARSPLKNLYSNAYKVDSFLSAAIKPSAVAGSTAKICSCQILNLESSNYDHRHIAVFAEKTNNGASADYRKAEQRIEKEKKQLKKLFYDKVKVIRQQTGAISCSALYVQLKSADRSLQLYDILNADIRF